MHPRLATAELELCLVTHLLEALGPQAVRRAAAGRRQRPELRQRLDAARLERLRPAAAHPGHEDEVVVGLELCAADVAEVADPAVAAGPRVGLVVALEGREEPLAYAAVVGAELRHAEALPLAAADLDVHALDRRPLHPPDLLGVEESWSTCAGFADRASFVSTGSYVPAGVFSRKSANPCQRPSSLSRYGW